MRSRKIFIPPTPRKFCGGVYRVSIARQSVADEIREKTGESPAGLYLDGYDFGGEADVCIDVVRDKRHMAYDAIIREITSDQSEDSETDNS